MIHCLHCGAETSNGLALCAMCQHKAGLCFEFLPVYFRNLARWRPGRASSSRSVPGSRVLYDGVDRVGTGDRISDRLDETANALTTWARCLIDDRPHFIRPLTWADAVLTGDLPDVIASALQEDPPRVIAALCKAFEDHLTSISTLDWCGDFAREITHQEELLRRLTEASIPGWYAGMCRCGRATYVVPGLTWVTCRACGASTAARDHLETILDEARTWVAPPMRLAEAVVALVDTESSVPRLHKRISKWGERGQLTALRKLDSDGDPCGPKRYRLSEVLEVLYAAGPTRLTEEGSGDAAVVS